ncbi:MAG: homocysteine S-methyltransferase family protein [Oscillospiraceae bacterium]
MENSGFILIDGGMGTQLQARGLKPGALPELLNLTDPETVLQIHREYVTAGADIITANTFGANARKLGGKATVSEIVGAGIKLAKSSGAKKVALDVGPTGTMLAPMGQLSFDEAYELFKETVIAGRDAGADLVIIETMSDLLEAKAALLAVKENSKLPVYVTMTFAEDGRTFLGTSPQIAAITLSSLGADAVGINCSLGPKEIEPFAEEMLKWSTVPVIVQPNAGLPKVVDGETVYPVGPEEFVESLGRMLDMGVTIAGGCCGTTPEHIALLRREMDRRSPAERKISRHTAFTSGQRAVVLDNSIAVIGERINPTGKKKIKEALRTSNFDYILNEAISQGEAGADVLDVNAGLPEIDEKLTLERLVGSIQAISPLPLQIDSSDPDAVDRAVRVYCGKPIINSVNGKEESLDAILPIAKKYGAAVVGLTLDENGIPDSAEERLEIARKIVSRAESMGIPKEDVLIDCLVLTVSTNQSLAMQTLKAVSLVTQELGVKTVLGVSNISFGLPAREVINSTFLAAAFGAGLTLPILNPMSTQYMDVVSSFKVLSGEDEGSQKFIAAYSGISRAPQEIASAEPGNITDIVLSGRKLLIQDAVRKALEQAPPMDVINNLLIPAINAAGDKFEKGEFFLPQLMSSAETVKLGFDVVKDSAKKGDVVLKGKILLATVRGDIHDIGKNIVKMLLSNYGYEIIDLGKDVPPELIVQETLRQHIKLVGLSALMTTTVRSIAVTIEQLKAAGADCVVMVGGAVLNEEYAKLVGADYYAKDAAESARIAGQVLG